MKKPITIFEWAMGENLVEWSQNELFGIVTITIKDVYPRTTADVLRILRDLLTEKGGASNVANE